MCVWGGGGGIYIDHKNGSYLGTHIQAILIANYNDATMVMIVGTIFLNCITYKLVHANMLLSIVLAHCKLCTTVRIATTKQTIKATEQSNHLETYSLQCTE